MVSIPLRKSAALGRTDGAHACVDCLIICQAAQRYNIRKELPVVQMKIGYTDKFRGVLHVYLLGRGFLYTVATAVFQSCIIHMCSAQ